MALLGDPPLYRRPSVKFQCAWQLPFNNRNNDEGFLSVILSREDYANIVGTATESAIRILSQFKKEGLITTSGKQIKILDSSKLSRVS